MIGKPIELRGLQKTLLELFEDQFEMVSIPVEQKLPDDLSAQISHRVRLQMINAAENYATSELLRLISSLEGTETTDAVIQKLNNLTRSGQMDQLIAWLQVSSSVI